MRHLLNIPLLCLIFCTALPGIADAKLFFTLYATGGEHSFAAEQDLNADPLSGFKLSLDFEGGKNSNDFSLEGSYNQFTTENLLDGSQLDATVTRLDVIYPLLQKTSWRPFLTVGIGRMFFDGPDNEPQDEDIVAYGAGLKYLVTEYLTLRAEGRHELIFNREDGNIDNYEYTASVGYTFGKRKPREKQPKPKAEPKPAPPPEPKTTDDDDLDGVKNPVDRCPGTPSGIKVDSSGCAEQTPDTPSSFREEIVPGQETQDHPTEQVIVEAAAPVQEPAVSESIPLREERVLEETKSTIELEEVPPTYVLPALPTVIAIPSLPPENQATAENTAGKGATTPSAAKRASPSAKDVLKTIAAIPTLPVAAVVALADPATGDKAQAVTAPAPSRTSERIKDEMSAPNAEHESGAGGSIITDLPSNTQSATMVAPGEIKTTAETSNKGATALAGRAAVEIVGIPSEPASTSAVRIPEKTDSIDAGTNAAGSAITHTQRTAQQTASNLPETEGIVAKTAIDRIASSMAEPQPQPLTMDGLSLSTITSAPALGGARDDASAMAQKSTALPDEQQPPGPFPAPTLAAERGFPSTDKKPVLAPETEKRTAASIEPQKKLPQADNPLENSPETTTAEHTDAPMKDPSRSGPSTTIDKEQAEARMVQKSQSVDQPATLKAPPAVEPEPATVEAAAVQDIEELSNATSEGGKTSKDEDATNEIVSELAELTLAPLASVSAPQTVPEPVKPKPVDKQPLPQKEQDLAEPTQAATIATLIEQQTVPSAQIEAGTEKTIPAIIQHATKTAAIGSAHSEGLATEAVKADNAAATTTEVPPKRAGNALPTATNPQHAMASTNITADGPVANGRPELRATEASTGSLNQPAPAAASISIPVCSGVSPHAILMLGKTGTNLLNIAEDEAQKDPIPFNTDATRARKTHVPTASFEFDTWLLTSQAKQVLSLLVKQLLGSQLDFSVRVEGHTDSVGSETYNYNLSVRRANAVATFLADEKGLDRSKISTAGCGEWKPLATNETDKGRSLNRRFELVILPNSK